LDQCLSISSTRTQSCSSSHRGHKLQGDSSENKPTGPVPAGSIGISNQVAKKIGFVGVRLVEDKRYGPSGEKFEATNIIGRVLDPEKLKDVKEDEVVYVREVRK